MEFHTGALGYGDEVQEQPRAVRQPQAVPSGIEAMLNSLSAQVRQLNARMARLETAIPKLAANDTKTAQYVNSLQGMVQQVSTKTDQAIQALRQFARGGGVQPQQFVSRASDAMVSYETPPRGQPMARSFSPAGDDSDIPVDPGGPATEVMEQQSDDALFFAGEED